MLPGLTYVRRRRIFLGELRDDAHALDADACRFGSPGPRVVERQCDRVQIYAAHLQLYFLESHEASRSGGDDPQHRQEDRSVEREIYDRAYRPIGDILREAAEVTRSKDERIEASPIFGRQAFDLHRVGVLARAGRLRGRHGQHGTEASEPKPENEKLFGPVTIARG